MKAKQNTECNDDLTGISSKAPSKSSRRKFLGQTLMGICSVPLLVSAAKAEVVELGKRNALGRRKRLRDIKQAFSNRRVRHRRNSDENKSFQYFASFSKGFPKDDVGEVSKGDYRLFLKALRTGNFRSLQRLGIGISRLANPEASRAYSLQGKDSAQFQMPPAPAFSSAESAAEMVELYWMSLARDVHFEDYESSSVIQRAMDNLSSMIDFRGPTSVPQAFRGNLPGAERGPYLSQFLLTDFFSGSMPISSKQRTVTAAYDHLTSREDWLLIQRGELFKGAESFDPEFRYIRNGRDLAEYVHNDQITQAYMFAAVSLLDLDLPPFDEGNPLFAQAATAPFTTFGKVHVIGLLGEVARLALQAAWYQKWQVHRRLRPEEFGGRVEFTRSGEREYPIHFQLLSSPVLDEVWNTHGSYLLPQGYREGCPTHPAYPAGHATIAGALVTILKAFFKEDFPIREPKIVSADGLTLQEYTGPDAGQLTLGGELNKLAENIALGRNFAGIHYRTDASEGFTLGEDVALALLRSQRHLYEEGYSFSLTKFNGERVQIRSRGV